MKEETRKELWKAKTNYKEILEERRRKTRKSERKKLKKRKSEK